MLALELTNVKDFMNKLLKSETFDNFLLQEAVITSAASYVIDGHIHDGFFSSEEISELGLTGYRLLPFRFLRGNCFDLIKGKKTPSSFKFIFSLSPENLHNTIEAASGSFTTNDVNGIFFNIRYQNEQLLLTTGVSYNIFSTDKTLENSWDAMMRKFLVNNDISFTIKSRCSSPIDNDCPSSCLI